MIGVCVCLCLLYICVCVCLRLTMQDIIILRCCAKMHAIILLQLFYGGNVQWDLNLLTALLAF